jgi:hypothetical protein
MRTCAIADIALGLCRLACERRRWLSGRNCRRPRHPYEPPTVYDHKADVIVYWWRSCRTVTFPKTGKRPKVGRLERIKSRHVPEGPELFPLLSVTSMFAREFPCIRD